MNISDKRIASLSAVALAVATTAAAAAPGSAGSTQAPTTGSTSSAKGASSKLAGTDRSFVMQAAAGQPGTGFTLARRTRAPL